MLPLPANIRAKARLFPLPVERCAAALAHAGLTLEPVAALLRAVRARLAADRPANRPEKYAASVSRLRQIHAVCPQQLAALFFVELHATPPLVPLDLERSSIGTHTETARSPCTRRVPHFGVSAVFVGTSMWGLLWVPYDQTRTSRHTQAQALSAANSLFFCIGVEIGQVTRRVPLAF